MPATPPPATAPARTAEDLAAREWPPLRAKLVDIAAALDRLDRVGPPGEGFRAEAERILGTLMEPGEADRAERVLKLLSLEYDPTWQERFAAHS